MSERIDQLFKDKLGEHSLPPSPQAWEKVQAGATGKKGIVFMWRMASVIVLLGVFISTWYYFSSDKVESPTQIAEKANTPLPGNKVLPDNSVQPNESSIQIKTERIASTFKERKREQTKELKSKQEPSPNDFQETKSEQIVVEEQHIVAEVAVIETSAIKEKPVVIEFTLPSMEEPKETVVIAANEEEKSSGLKKLLESARDVKNGDAQLGANLREMKNELLAFDFKKDKTKRN